jgi:hypothetical protein
MTLNGLTQEQMQMIYESIKINPNINESIKSTFQPWIKLQLDEQVKGGAWKARIRESGMVI